MNVHLAPTHHRAVTRTVTAAVLLLSPLPSACSSADAGADAATSSTTAQANHWPRSMVVLGHSGVNGEGTPGTPLENSWASGSNPDVDSIYLRMVEHEPALEGHVVNLAEGGATLPDVDRQADEALELDPAPDLVIVQVVDNDMACPVTQAEVDTFQSDLSALLGRLVDGLPGARVFIPTFYAEPASYIQSLTPEQRVLVGDEGPCAIVAPNGKPNRTELRRLEAIVDKYDAAIMAACASTTRCWHDGGAFERTRLHRGDIGADLSHLSIEGNAHAAAVAWRAMRKAGIRPRA